MACLNHVAVWTLDIERLVVFYRRYFGAKVENRYVNTSKGFESCFLQFDRGTKLEIMRTTSFTPVAHDAGAQRMGLTHLAISVGSMEHVDELTDRLRNDGCIVLDGPRQTGDGYYESVVLDPDGTRVEITL